MTEGFYIKKENAHHMQTVKNKEKKQKKSENGDAGYRSPYLSHAKRALYHLSYIPKLAKFDITTYLNNEYTTKVLNYNIRH